MIMRRTPSKVLFLGLFVFALFLYTGSNTIPIATAQIPLSNTTFVNDGTLWVYASLDGTNLKTADENNPIKINMDAPMDLYLQINTTSTQNLNMTGKITFYYQEIAVYPIQIIDQATNSTWVPVDHITPPPPVTAAIPLDDALKYGPVKLMTGKFEASIDFSYYFEGSPETIHSFSSKFYFSIPATPQDVFTSVTGISAGIATIGAVVGVGRGFMSLFEGLKTAYKLRGIHKKASELRSLPNLTVIGALPLLFSMLAGMTKMGRKKDKESEEGKEDKNVSEYIIRQRLREVAPDAWPMDKCPRCTRNWNKKLNMCKKCNLTEDDARREYADLLASRVPVALKVMGKKKSADVRTLAKKTKSTDYNAGVIAAAMVDTDATEIVKVGTPLRSFVLNIAGLAFLVVTWQQLLGDRASTFQTTITVVGAALSLAVIVALYISRRTQIQKFQADMDDGKKWMPTEAEAAEEASKEEEEPEVTRSPEEEIPQEEMPEEESELSEEHEETSAETELTDENSETESYDGDEYPSDEEDDIESASDEEDIDN